MLSCEEVSILVSESLDHKLPLGKRVNLWLHLFMCRLCRWFRKDLRHLEKVTRRYPREAEHDSADSTIGLSEESRERMKRVIASQSS